MLVGLMMGRINWSYRRPRRYLVASRIKGDNVSYEVKSNIRTAKRSGRIIYISNDDKLLQHAKKQLQHSDKWLVYIDNLASTSNHKTSLNQDSRDLFASSQLHNLQELSSTQNNHNNVVTQVSNQIFSRPSTDLPFTQLEHQHCETEDNTRLNKGSKDVSHSQQFNTCLLNKSVVTEEKKKIVNELVTDLVPFQPEIQEPNNVNEQSKDISHSQSNISLLDNRTVTQENKDNYIILEADVLHFSQYGCEPFETNEGNIVNEQNRDISHLQSNSYSLDNRIVTQELKENFIILDTDVGLLRDKHEQIQSQNNNTSLNKNNVDKFLYQQQTTSQKCETYLQNCNIVTQVIMNNLDKAVPGVPFCQNENEHSEIPANNIFHPSVDNYSENDNTAAHQKEINNPLTILHYESERPKSQNIINLNELAKTREESLLSLHQESGIALEINNVSIQENEVDAIKSVESMCVKRTSKREKKYHLDESEDEPFSADASEDEFVPDSFDESDESITSRSSFAVTGYIPTNIKGCKRKLNFTEFTTLNIERDVDCQPSNSKQYFEEMESQVLSCDSFTSQPCTSKESFNKSRSQSVSAVESVRSESSHYSLTSADISYARLHISQDTAIVLLKTENILHQGSYHCRLIDDDQSLLGFVHLSVPDNTHKCSFLDTTLTNKVAVIIFREHSKSTEQEAKIRVEYCLPQGDFKGKELKHDRMYLSPLVFSGGHTDGVNTDKTSSKSVQQTKNSQTRNLKLHCCIYCEKMISEITKHLLRKHKQEREIVEILNMEINTKERNIALKRLRIKGDDRFNVRVLPNERIPLRQPSSRDLSSSVTCYKCSGLVAPTNFARHERTCNKNEMRPPNREKVLAKARLLEKTRSNLNQPVFSTLQENLVNALIKPLQAGVILHEILSDICLQLVTVRYAIMHRNVPGALKNDRQNLRRLARLLLEIREANPTVLDFEDCILHSGYDALLEGVFKMCALDTSSGIFGKPALAQVMSSVITFMINALQDSYIRQGISKDTTKFKKLEDFKTLHQNNYSIYIGRSAGRTRLEQRASKQNMLPSSRDVKQFSQYIIAEGKNAYTSIVENGFSYDAWLQLGKSVLAKIIVFNRRRVSEVASMTLELYENKTALSEQQKSNLSVLERSLADTYKIMALIGKRNHILHLLLDEDQCRYLDLFISFRKKAGVADSNPYLFGVPTNILYIDATHVLREFSVKCGAENPSLLRTTYLRKQVATLAQLLTLNDNQIAQVAKLMGHSQKVHEDVYRQDENLFQVTCWAKFLSVITEDDVGKYKGKTFEEIVNITNALELNDDFTGDDYLTVNELIEQQHSELSNVASDEEARGNININIRTPSKKLQHLSEVKKTTPRKSPKKSTTKNLTFSPKKTTPQKPTIAKILHQINFSPPKNHARTRVSFNQRQVEIMTDYFNHYIINGQLAPFDKCRQVIEENNKIFSGRYERDIYNWVQYQRNKFKRTMK